MSEPLDWSVRAIDVPEGGLRETRSASAGERATLAEALEVMSCDRLDANYSLRAIGGGAYNLAGKVKAAVTQPCVVTLDPLVQFIEGEFDVEFRPAGKLPATADDEEFEALSAAEIEPLEHGRIDIGRIIFETLSASVDPYPRSAGAELDPEAAEAGGQGDAGPFAALKALKDKN
jgi:uncharacterized metal-binding protein YceD (DUF177 family)